MRLRWLPQATEDLENIKNYLTEHQPQFAQSTVQRLYEGIRALKNTPYRGRTGSVADTRELVFTPLPYIAVYRVKGQTIEILHIWHGAQDRST